MQQINFLSSETKQKKLPWELVLMFTTRILLVFFVVILVYYGYVFFRSKKIATTIYEKQTDVIKLQNDILNSEGRKELLVRQGQLAEAVKLISAHPYWSKLLLSLGQVTFKSAAYLGLNANNKGSLDISAVVPNYADLDKFLQVFDSPDFNKNFSDVRVVSVGKFQVGESSGIKFDVNMKYDTNILKPGN